MSEFDDLVTKIFIKNSSKFEKAVEEEERELREELRKFNENFIYIPKYKLTNEEYIRRYGEYNKFGILLNFKPIKYNPFRYSTPVNLDTPLICQDCGKKLKEKDFSKWMDAIKKHYKKTKKYGIKLSRFRICNNCFNYKIKNWNVNKFISIIYNDINTSIDWESTINSGSKKIKTFN